MKMAMNRKTWRNSLHLYGSKTLSYVILLVFLDTRIGFLAASITMTVHPSRDVEVNQLVTIQCTFSQTPIVAYFHSSINPSVPFCSLETTSGVCKNNSDCASQYSTTCPNSTTYSVQYPIPLNWTGANIYCRGIITGNEKSNNVTFNIVVPVASVTLTSTQIVVNVNEVMKLTCRTDYSNPAANITWYKNSVDITSNGNSTKEENINTGLFRTISDLQYTGVALDNGQQVYCEASNKPGVKVESNKYNLDVRYPPSADPIITASPPGLQYNSGTRVTLTCHLSGGNPVATLSWKCKNTAMTEANQNNSTTAVSVLLLVMGISYNNQQCSCTANHNLLTSPKSTSVSLTVFYPPSTDPVITASPSGLRYNNGTRVTLTCKLQGGNPLATLSWKCNNTAVTGANRNNSTTAVSVLLLVMDSSYNNQQCSCTANHYLLTSPKSASVSLTVFYPPSTDPVITASPSGLQYINGTRVDLTCHLSGANPLATLSWRCKNALMKGINQSTSTTAVSVLSLLMDSSYNNEQCSCTANHSLLTSPKSTSVSFTVFYNNKITSNWNQTYSLKEHEKFQLVCEVDGNPSSNITWVFVGNNSVIEKVYNVKKSILEIPSANCLDYGTYTVSAYNGIGPYANKTANLSVNCKPRLYTNFQTPVKIGIGNNDSLQIFVRILLYPPAINSTWNFSRKKNESNVIRDSIDGYRIIYVNGDVEQNITLNKEKVDTEDFGNYILRVQNEVGVFTRIYHVDSTRPPIKPTNFTVLCENSMSIKLSWISNFNGGDEQSFQISYSTDEYLAESLEVLETNISDKGYGMSQSYIPSTELQGALWFTITASNKFGNTTSDAIYCNAVKRDTVSSDNIPVIAGAATGGLIFAGLVILGMVFFLRTMNESGGKKKDIHQSETILTEDRESDEDDGLKENKLYISAGPRDDEKPGISGTAVYAEVNKKGPTSDSNASVYAEVQKSGKTAKNKDALYSDTTKQKQGFFKKEEKAKQKKAKKMKQNKEVTEVYENPEDIVMTQNLDNVYSNTADETKREKHGYKNQDGLLYVEVQFDQRQGSGKPVIHGEDEKTDYATVEFPFPPSSNSEKPTDEK